MKKLFLMAAGCLIMIQTKAGAIPSQITYQGTLKQNGVPTNALKNMTFALVSSDGKTPYSLIISSQVSVINGLFSIPLSFQLVVPYTWDTITPYIQVSVEGQTLGPIEPVTATIYATVAGSVINGAIGTPQLAPMAVTSTTIADGAVGTSQLAPMAVTSTTIANGAVGTPQLAAMAVTSATIANGAVTTAQIAPGAVTSTIIANQNVTTVNLANASVTTPQLADGAVTIAKLDPSIQQNIIPSGMIAMFTGGCPAGWTRFTTLDNAFPMGSASYGASGGSPTSTTSHGVVFGSLQGSGSGVAYWKVGDITGHDSPVSTLPPYVTMVFCAKS